MPSESHERELSKGWLPSFHSKLPLALSSSKIRLSWDSREVAQPDSGTLGPHPPQFPPLSEALRSSRGTEEAAKAQRAGLVFTDGCLLGMTLASGKHTDLLKVSGPGLGPRMLMECWFLLPRAQSMGFDPPPEHPEVAGGCRPLIQSLTPNCYRKSKLPTPGLPAQESELGVWSPTKSTHLVIKS